MKTAEQSALAFVAALRTLLTPEQFATMQCLNAAEKIPGVCHSHDFIDANEVMAAAVDAGDEVTDETCARMSAAWDIARPLLRGESLFPTAQPPEEAAHCEVDGSLNVIVGDTAAIIPLSDYFENPRDVDITFWCGGRECAEPVTFYFDDESPDAIAAHAFALAAGKPGVCEANDGIAMDVLRELDGVNGWRLQPADHRGMNLGGAELSLEFVDGAWLTVGVYCCEFSGQWIVTAWNGRNDAGNLAAETFDTPAAEHGGELCSDDALQLVRDAQARLTLNAPAVALPLLDLSGFYSRKRAARRVSL